MPTVQDFWHHIRNLPVVEGRDHHPTVTLVVPPRQKKYPSVHASWRPPPDEWKSQWQLQAVNNSESRTFVVISCQHYSEAQASRICGLITDAFVRWPRQPFGTTKNIVPGKTIDHGLGTRLFNAAAAHLYPTMPQYATSPSIMNRSGIYYALHLPAFDPTTYEFNPLHVTTSTRSYSMDPLPDTPDGVAFTFNGEWKKGYHYLPSRSPTGLRVWKPLDSSGNLDSPLRCDKVPGYDKLTATKKNRAAQAGHSLMLLGAMAISKSPMLTSDDVKTLIAECRWSVASDVEKLVMCGLIAAVYRMADRGFGIMVMPPVHTGPKKKPTGIIFIRSFNYGWVKVWAHAVYNVLSSTHHIKALWEYAAETADNINMRIVQGEATPYDYNCAGTTCSESQHLCQGCGHSTSCGALSMSPIGLSECGDCIGDGWDTGKERLRRALRASVRCRLQKEANKASILSIGTKTHVDRSIVQHEGILDALMESHVKFENGLMWALCLYSGKWVQPFPNGSKLLATGLSFEGIWPLAAIDTGYVTNHGPDNVCFAQLYVNYGKGTQLPVFLHHIGHFLRQRQRLEPSIRNSAAARDELQRLETELVLKCHLANLIRMKMPYRMGTRLLARQHLTQEMYDYLMEEWVSGKLHPGSNWIPKYTCLERDMVTKESHSLSNVCPWTQQEVDRIKSTIASIEEYTRVILPRSRGCPVFVNLATAPQTWSWTTAGLLCSRSLKTMEIWCNRHWETVDTAETIFLECIFQVSVRKMVISDNDPLGDMKRFHQSKYEELLGLPLVVGKRNGLQYSMAHRVHGMQMRTGWSQTPLSLIDRDDAINNILVESRFTNFAKSNFPPSSYPEIQKCFLEIDMPRRLVQDVVPTTFNSKLERRISEALEKAFSAGKEDDDSDSGEEELSDGETGEPDFEDMGMDCDED